MANVNWSWDENKIFENALTLYPEDAENRWELIAELLPGKTAQDVKAQYQKLIQDLEAIEAGLVPLPAYREFSEEEMAEARKKLAEEQEAANSTGFSTTEGSGSGKQ
ncbi:protein RADIALIS-like 6 [Lactuca sativa]|uniref:protein RADIALIS-like 6 n=1 Tax=Lactuca sativa TaxID=4236 RepID=UPI000CB1D6B5|nr:protein RADIALIS-like 6 [Lactuca sativa]